MSKQFKTLDEAKGFIGHDAVLRAVNTHEDLLYWAKAIVRDAEGSEESEGWTALEKLKGAIAKAEGK